MIPAASPAVPVRLRLSRVRGFDLQAFSRATNGLECVVVARPTVFGNPWTIRAAREAGYSGDDRTIARWCVELFTAWVAEDPRSITRMLGGGEQRLARLKADLSRLRGRNVACWCCLCPTHAVTGKPAGITCDDCTPCHGDVLLALNSTPTGARYDRA